MDPTIQLLQAVTAGARTGEAAPLRVGQVLLATAAAVAESQVQLRIGNRTVAAATQVPIEPGQRLRLEVTQLQPQVLLRILPEPRPADPLNSARAQLLPRQGALAPLLATPLPPSGTPERPWLAALRQLLQQLPARAQLSDAAGLRRGVADSGLFLEARLAAGQPPSPTDLKGQLLRLLQQLPAATSGTAAPPEHPPEPPRAHSLPSPQAPLLASDTRPEDAGGLVRQQAEGALARLTLHQLATVQAQREGQATWLLELPVRTGGEAEVVPLRIAREGGHAAAEEEARWSVNLALDLPGLGPLNARVTLQGGQVGTLFWAEQEETRTLLRAHLAELRERFAGQGLAVGEVQCLAGKPPQPPPEPGAPLLDERA